MGILFSADELAGGLIGYNFLVLLFGGRIGFIEEDQSDDESDAEEEEDGENYASRSFIFAGLAENSSAAEAEKEG